MVPDCQHTVSDSYKNSINTNPLPFTGLASPVQVVHGSGGLCFVGMRYMEIYHQRLKSFAFGASPPTYSAGKICENPATVQPREDGPPGACRMAVSVRTWRNLEDLLFFTAAFLRLRQALLRDLIGVTYRIPTPYRIPAGRSRADWTLIFHLLSQGRFYLYAGGRTPPVL